MVVGFFASDVVVGFVFVFFVLFVGFRVFERFGVVVGRVGADRGFILRVLVACLGTFGIIQAVPGLDGGLIGILGALLAVQTSFTETFRIAAERVLAIFVGVAVAILVSSYGGLNAVTLVLILGFSLVLSAGLGLQENKLEVPISALLILSVSQVGDAAETRILNSLIGIVVGLLTVVVFPPSVGTGDAVDAVTDLAEDTAGIVEKYALAMVSDVDKLNSGEYVREIHDVFPKVLDVSETIEEVQKESRFNPRTVLSPRVGDTLLQSVATLDACLVSLREIMVNMRQQNNYEWGRRELDELSGVVSTVLYDVSQCIRLFGVYTRSVSEGRDVDAERDLEMMLVALREAAALADKKLFVDVEGKDNLKALRFTLLQSVYSIISELSPENVPAPTPVKPVLPRKLRPIRPVLRPVWRLVRGVQRRFGSRV